MSIDQNLELLYIMLPVGMNIYSNLFALVKPLIWRTELNKT